MQLAKGVRVGAWLLIGFNLLMAMGAIWVFIRMAPAIAVIIDRNERTLEACEEMLAALALSHDRENMPPELKARFADALRDARANITEAEEPSAIEAVAAQMDDAFSGDPEARKKIVSAISLLGKINREAMIKEDERARQLGSAGAWGVVFMAVGIFLVGMLFKRNLHKHLVDPLEEIHSVVRTHLAGDRLRRCKGFDLPRDIRIVFRDFNDFLDRM